MKNNLEEAKRWFKEAEYNIKEADDNLQLGHYALVCFLSEQTIQKILKAYLYFSGKRYITIHSITELIGECINYDTGFSSFKDNAKIINQYYIPTRYPNAQPLPAVPYEQYTKQQSKEALSIVRNIYQFVKEKMEGL